VTCGFSHQQLIGLGEAAMANLTGEFGIGLFFDSILTAA
jgi:hypothetical protein